MPGSTRRNGVVLGTASSGSVQEDNSEQQCAAVILPTTEMGYILLSQCRIGLSSSSQGEESDALKGVWIDVTLVQGEVGVTSAGSCTSDATDFCCHCNLVLDKKLGGDTMRSESDNSNLLQLSTANVKRFDGTVHGMVHPEEPYDHCHQKRRSDASLLIGAILDAQDHGYTAVQSMKVLLHNGGERSNGALASLLVTLSFPSLASSTNGKVAPRRHPNSIVPVSRRTRNGLNHKPLPASVQFILSVVQCDWDRLDTSMQVLQEYDSGDHSSSNRKSKIPEFFPPKLSLEELYGRIEGSNTRRELLQLQQYNTREVHLLNLPNDVLRTQVASFLQAKSLDSLRCTCKSLHKRLEDVVPGLKLRLYTHQIKSLQWMRQREIQPISEAKGHDALSTNQHFYDGDSDPIRAMTGGQSVWLCRRWNINKEERREADHNVKRNLGIRVHQVTGIEMNTDAENGVLARQGARGGLLCDDPGLGKTISILSLILTTFGISTTVDNYHNRNGAEKHVHVASPEEQIFQMYWKEEITADFRRPALNRFINKVKRLHPAMDYFIYPMDPSHDGYEDYSDVVERPICLNDIQKKLSSDGYGNGNSAFDAFVADVERCFLNAIQYNSPEHNLYTTAQKLLQQFRSDLLPAFKKDQMSSVRSSVTNTGVKPNSSLAVLMQKKAQNAFHQSLIQSSSTLLVIPSVLMEHWEDQIRMHVNFSYFTAKIPLIYEYTPARKSALGTEEAIRLCQVDNTHCPLVFLDKAGTHKLPSAEFLSMFRIVITTTKRFTNEWKNGSFQEELQRKQAEMESAEGAGKYVNYRLLEYGSSDEEACPLLKVHWLRLVVDEGHAMGRGKGNSAIRFASWISAQRRWAMTGTPTKQTASQNGLNNMHGLLCFLQHDFFSARSGGDQVWKRHIAKSWTDGNLAAFFRLRSLLSLLMIRHTKLDIKELCPPQYDTTVIPMSPLQVTTYNTLVFAVQANLLLTSFEGSRTSGEQDSLLHRSQAKFAYEALTNIRLVCCGGTLVFPTITEKNWDEFFSLCNYPHRMDPSKIEKLKQFVRRSTTEELSACDCCGMLLSTLLVLPCSCLLCTECVPDKTDVCLMCNAKFDVDDFQRLQPGFDFQWKNPSYAEEQQLKDKRGGKEKITQNHHVDSYGSSAVDERRNTEAVGLFPGSLFWDEQDVDAHGQGQLPLRPPSERRRTRKPGDGHVCEYSPFFTPGKCILCFAEHDHCRLINAQSCCGICYKKAEECPNYESKSYYLYKKLMQLYKNQQERDSKFSPSRLVDERDETSSRHRPLKVIVFSQFRKTLNVVGDRLIRGFGTAHVAEYWGTYRTSELHKFTHNPECFVMLLGKDGSEGLDLSFVTHLVFLEAVWDKSLEQQAIARAWRMGASGPVTVETLLAKSSVEEQLWKLEQVVNNGAVGIDPAESDRSDHDLQNVCSASETANRSDYQRAKLHFCLKTLRLIPEIELVPLPPPERTKIRLHPPAASAESLAPAKRRRISNCHVRFMV